MTVKLNLFIPKINYVEPIIAFYIFAMNLTRPALENLKLQKACLQLNFTPETCAAILNGSHKDSNLTSENQLVQISISEMHAWQQPLQSCTPLILVLFVGAFSDKYKLRKPFVLLPLIGELISTFASLLCVYFMAEAPLELVGFAQRILPSLFGGQTLLVMASIAYVADTSTLESRTYRIGVLQIIINLAGLVSHALSGFIYFYCGYYGVLFSAFLLHCSGLVYCYVIISESAAISWKWHHFIELFNYRYALETIKLLASETSGALNALLVIVFVYKSAMTGENSLSFLYTQGVFQWTPVEFSYFLSANSLIQLIGTTFALTLFAKILQLNDFLILIIAILDRIVVNICFGLARTVALLYAGVALSVLAGLIKVANRSLTTKLVPASDLGKAQSLFGICDAIVPSIAVPLYNKIYQQTIQIYPAAFFFVSIVLYAICCLLVLCIYIRNRNKMNLNYSPR